MSKRGVKKEKERWQLNLKVKFITLFLCIALIPLIVAVYISYDSSKRVLQEKSAHYLYSISDDRINQIEDVFKEKKNNATALTRIPSVVGAITELNQIFSQQGINSLAYQRAENSLRPILTYFKESSNADDFFIFSPDKTLIFSIEDKEMVRQQLLISLFPELDSLLDKSKSFLESQISNFQYNEETEELTAFIVVPVVNESNFIGFAVLKINHQDIYNLATNYIGLGETGETVIALRKDEQIIFIAPLRNDLSGEINKKINLSGAKDLGIYRAVQNERGWGVVKDYRGEEVLAVWRYLPSLKWGLVVKMDLDEVLSMADELRTRLLIVGLMLLSIIILITLFMAHSIVDPIKKLTKVTKKISQGDFLVRAKINSRDEIEDLAKSFNKMTDQLAQNLDKIEEKNQELQKEKNKAWQEKDKLESILESIGDGVLVINQEEKVTIFNPEAELISGFNEQEIINQPFDKFLKFIEKKNNQLNEDNFISEALEKGIIKNTKLNTVLKQKNKQEIPVSGRAAPLKDKNERTIGCVVIIRDVTRERKIDQAKTEFVSLASHQLRTPLSAINWYAEMILDEDVGKINQKQKKYLKSLYEANHRMINLVNSLLNVSRVELGTFVIEPTSTDFIKVAESVIKELEHHLDKRQIKLNKKYEPDLPLIKADEKLLRIIIQNLLSNAIKYTPEKGSVDLEIKKDNQDVLIAVKDTGLGIPEKEQSKIFSKLFRGKNVMEKDTDGTGLGLYIVKEVVTQSGGKIWFKSEKNKGSTFFVTIPLTGMKRKKEQKFFPIKRPLNLGT
jgi:two-component system, sensor histidine kinase and response regulator